MRSLFVAIVVGMSAVAIASPIAEAQTVDAPSQCSQDCWNESAVKAGCDPNADDACLCGPFFSADAECVLGRCDAGESLQVVNTLTLACDQ